MPGPRHQGGAGVRTEEQVSIATCEVRCGKRTEGRVKRPGRLLLLGRHPKGGIVTAICVTGCREQTYAHIVVPRGVTIAQTQSNRHVGGACFVALEGEQPDGHVFPPLLLLEPE